MDVHVYWTKDDNAEEYLGVVSNVAAAGRIAIPTSHTKGFIRIQIQGGGVGNTSQYSGLAQVKSLYDIDTDKDGLTDKQEVTGSANAKYGKHRTDPTRADSDWGGAKDGAEAKRGTDPAVSGK